MPFTRWEFILYSAVSIVPFIVLLFLSSKKYLRFGIAPSIAITVPFVIIWMMIQFGAVYRYFSWIGIADIISPLVVILLLFILFDDHIGRILFAFLVICNFSNLCVCLAKYSEGLISPSYAAMRYHWTFSSLLLGYEIIICFFLWHTIFRDFSSFDTPEYREIKIERYLWLIPATFYVVWMYMFYSGDGSAVAKLAQLYYVLTILTVDLGSLVVYRVIIQTVREQAENLELRAKNFNLQMISLQYQNIEQKIQQTRRLRHDLRHILAVIGSMAEASDWEHLQKYITEVQNSTDLATPIKFCENNAVNAVLSYYVPQMKKDAITASIQLSLPDDLKISSSDLSILFANLVENAIEACRHQIHTERKITIQGSMHGDNTIAFTFTNTYSIQPKTDSRGVLLSIKHDGNGIGVESVRVIVKKYNGHMDIKAENNVFTVKILLLTE